MILFLHVMDSMISCSLFSVVQNTPQIPLGREVNSMEQHNIFIQL